MEMTGCECRSGRGSFIEKLLLGAAVAKDRYRDPDSDRRSYCWLFLILIRL